MFYRTDDLARNFYNDPWLQLALYWEGEAYQVESDYDYLRLRLRSLIEAYPGCYATTLVERARSLMVKIRQEYNYHPQTEEWSRADTELQEIITTFDDIHHSATPLATLARLAEADKQFILPIAAV